ncbi:MAG TPA: di-trans,poly-cis-decaprenylcistransferase [Gammaproteobacteria bacterium]|mgnify:FL=1|nr:di-trans,poly-cis-decaprenylcistransferase [Gammaproteobacteria bacterium]
MKSDALPSVPRHIAIIMDGNNRWAKAHGLAAKAGHRRGAEVARNIVNACIDSDISFLTLFAFSSENWLRPTEEVQGLMALFLLVLKRKEIKQFHDKNVRIKFIGNRNSFSEKLQKNMASVEALTLNNTGLTVVVAADYGGRWDVAEAAKAVALKALNKEFVVADIDSQMIAEHLSLSPLPDPDLCIRTGGERRISNFLLWQFAYTELYFTDCFWPDFSNGELELALRDYAQRQRRFGGHNQEANV